MHQCIKPLITKVFNSKSTVTKPLKTFCTYACVKYYYHNNNHRKYKRKPRPPLNKEVHVMQW